MAKQDESGNAATASPAAAVTPQKRVLPARERRESATKREASELNLTIAAAKSSPAKKSTPSKQTPKKTPESKSVGKRKRDSISEVTPVQETSIIAKEEPLPIKVIDSKALPTLLQPQSSKQLSSQYQSIAESAVLAASLHRSRSRWLADGIFERYWTKPTKKKMAEGLPSQPELKSMQKLGASSITVGPHTFEASIYMVRDSVPYRPPTQQPPRPVGIQPNFQSYQPPVIQQTVPQVRASGSPAVRIPESPSAEKPVQVKIEQPSKVGPTEPQKAGLTEASDSTTSSSSSASTEVIRMLASRAATNPELKELMKVVASSKASPGQLKIFQGHIDELTALIRRQQNTSGVASEAHSSQRTDHTKPPQIDKPHMIPNNPPQTLQTTHPVQPVQPVLPASSQSSVTTPNNPGQPKLQHASRIGPLGPPLAQPIPTVFPSYIPMPPKMPVPEPHIKAIVIEFLTPPPGSATSLAPDRYLFPEYAVLDTPISGQGLEMVCSFLVVRKGPTKEDYHQPVTLTIKTSHHKILETIARAAKPLPEVQEKMKEIMATTKRVKDEWLALRLPRQLDGSGEGATDS